MRDPYAVLGVAKDASAEDIKKAYKKLARKHHPDLAKTEADGERFKEINAAYDVLGDAEKRRLFDEFGEVSTRPGFDADQARAYQAMGGGRGFRGFGGGGFGGGGFGGSGGTPGGGFRWSTDGPDLGGGFGGGAGGFVDADDLLGSIFGGARARRGPRPGQDIHAEVHVSLLQVARAEPIELELRRPVVTGGGGQATMSMQEEKLKVRLPPGVEDGRTILLRGKGGDAPSGGPPGDLKITIRIQPVAGLRRDGEALELDLPITFAEALVGGRVTVPTFDGEVKVTLPPGSQQGQKLRLRGKGMKLAHGRGDLILVLRPTPPASGGPDAETLAAQLAALYDQDVRASLPI